MPRVLVEWPRSVICTLTSTLGVVQRCNASMLCDYERRSMTSHTRCRHRYAALEMQYISEFHAILGNTTGATYWAHRANVTIEAIHALLWDEDDQFYYYRSSDTKTFVKVQTPSGFAPLLLPGVSDARVSALIGHINDPNKFASKVPLPTVAMDYVTDQCPTSSTNMWRRPTWTNTNLFTIWGLRRYAHVPGALEAAARLQQQTVEMVGKEYEQWGAVFEFYDSNGVVAPVRRCRFSVDTLFTHS
jgi:neutral trehalase